MLKINDDKSTLRGVTGLICWATTDKRMSSSLSSGVLLLIALPLQRESLVVEMGSGLP